MLQKEEPAQRSIQEKAEVLQALRLFKRRLLGVLDPPEHLQSFICLMDLVEALPTVPSVGSCLDMEGAVGRTRVDELERWRYTKKHI